jgi:hypothetical protein
LDDDFVKKKEEAVEDNDVVDVDVMSRRREGTATNPRLFRELLL